MNLSNKTIVTFLTVLFLAASGVSGGGLSSENNQPYVVKIGRLHDALPGTMVNVPITLEQIDQSKGLTNFDFTVVYDQRGLYFVEALEGAIFEECGWEGFTYRLYPDSTTQDDKRMVSVYGTADRPYPAESPNPACQLDNPGYVGELPVTLAILRFYVIDDWHNCYLFAPIRFYWNECSDNVVWGYELHHPIASDSVYDYGDNSIADPTDGLPSYRGVQDFCLETGFPYVVTPTQGINFRNGGVDIYCPELYFVPGDINLNSMPFEPTDALLYLGYFLYGLSVFEYPDGSVAYSDVNADGIPLTVPDVVYLIRVVTADALPYPQLNPSPDPVYVTQDPDAKTVEFTAVDTLGAMILTFQGEIVADSTQVGYTAVSHYHPTDNETRVVIFSMLAGKSLRTGVALYYSGNGQLTDVLSATYHGRPVEIIVGSPSDVDNNDAGSTLPGSFELQQNYPNPFNPTTTIEFALPTATDVEIWVYNVTGQRVRTLVNRTMPAGYHEIAWDGTNDGGEQVGSGVYFYRIEAGDFVQSKKMMLLK